MRLTRKQQRALDNVLAFAPPEFRPSDAAVEWFFARSDRGAKIPYAKNKDYRDYADLLLAHHMMSGAQEAIWLDGHLSGDYPLGALIRDYITNIADNRATYKRHAPAFRKLLGLWKQTCFPHYA